jgi:hypothetical protein
MFDQTKRVIIDGIERRSDDRETPRRQPQPQVVRSAARPGHKSSSLFPCLFSFPPHGGSEGCFLSRGTSAYAPATHGTAPLSFARLTGSSSGGRASIVMQGARHTSAWYKSCFGVLK